MRAERVFLWDEEASSALESYPAWMVSLIYLSAAAFGMAFWSGLVILLFR